MTSEIRTVLERIIDDIRLGIQLDSDIHYRGPRFYNDERLISRLGGELLIATVQRIEQELYRAAETDYHFRHEKDWGDDDSVGFYTIGNDGPEEII